jgi:hypothetical protein
MVRQQIPTPAQVRAVANLVDRIDAAREAIERHQHEVSALASIRTEAAQLLRQTLSVAQMADLLGLSEPAVYKMLRPTEVAPSTTTAVQELLAANDDLIDELDAGWRPPADKRISQTAEGSWVVWCPSHGPGAVVAVEFPNDVLAQQYLESHDKAEHGIGLS